MRTIFYLAYSIPTTTSEAIYTEKAERCSDWVNAVIGSDVTTASLVNDVIGSSFLYALGCSFWSALTLNINKNDNFINEK